MLEPTKENVRKASVIADFLDRTGYMPYLFFDTGRDSGFAGTS